uniref:Uncharacterized protein n=1 Tax=Anopheles melas TaxID=34690 RepID=A0A182TLU5_9DIPT
MEVNLLVANLYLILLKAHRAQQILDLACWIFTILVGRNVLFHIVHILGPLGSSSKTVSNSHNTLHFHLRSELPKPKGIIYRFPATNRRSQLDSVWWTPENLLYRVG